MDNKIEIQTAVDNCPDLDAPRVARFTDLSIHANGSVHVNYSIDVLSQDKSKVMIANQERGEVSFNSMPISRGGEVIEDEITPEIAALVTAIKPKIKTILKTLNPDTNE